MRTVGAMVAGAIAGLALGYQLWSSSPVVETPLPELRQEDGSLVLERKPDANAKPAHQLPRGSTLERTAQLTIAPTPTADSTGNCSCKEVTVDLSLVRQPDETRRVVASVDGGTLVRGVDVPIASAQAARRLVWAAGVERDVLTGRMGGFLERDLDRVFILPLPLRVGVSHVPGDRGGRWGLRVGVRF